MLKMTALTLYKHGLGFFERSGNPTVPHVDLSVPRRAMNDVLKSLIVVPAGAATVHSIAFETPADRNPEARRAPIAIDDRAALGGMVAAFAGARVRITAGDRTITGRLIGLEREHESHLKRALLLVSNGETITPIPVHAITTLALDDPRERDDLAFALDSRQRDEARANLRIALSAPAALDLSYVAPAPAWRVSYRVLIETADETPETQSVFVQGWALFDNTLDEDLENVRLTLTAGMPVSFRYDLHQPNTPERPMLQDEVRTLHTPLQFTPKTAVRQTAIPAAESLFQSRPRDEDQVRMRLTDHMTAEDITESAPPLATGEDRGALFAYVVDAPVSIRRGESGMVPIVSFRHRGQRELIYNATKHPCHPAVSVTFSVPPDVTLERGPALMVENGAYGGEGIVPFTVGGSDIILAFALELGVKVSSQTSVKEETTKISFRDRSVFIDTVSFRTTTYELVSTLAKPTVIVVEHPRLGNAELVTEPVTSMPGLARFRCLLAPREHASLPVVERTVHSRRQSVTGLTGAAVQSYLEHNLLTANLAVTIKTLLKHQAEMSDLEQKRLNLESERETIRKRIDDCVKSLTPLDPTRDAALRDRFVHQLDLHDNAMRALDERDRDFAARIAQLQTEVDAAERKLASAAPT